MDNKQTEAYDEMPRRPDIRNDDECDKYFMWALAYYDQIHDALVDGERLEAIVENLEGMKGISGALDETSYSKGWDRAIDIIIKELRGEQ